MNTMERPAGIGESGPTRKEPEMRRQRRPVIVALAFLTILSGVTHALPVRAQEPSVEERLIAFSGRLKLSLSIASFAIYAPTIGDLHLHAQQLVNLLEGTRGPHYVRLAEAQEAERGLRSDMGDLLKWFGEVPLEPEARVRMAAATRNMAAYLEYALNSALFALKSRRLEPAAQEMLKTHAFLAAAYERPSGVSSVPGLWTVLYLFELVDAAGEKP